MIMEAEKGLKETKNKVKKDQDRNYELLKGQHIDSQTSGQGKEAIGISSSCLCTCTLVYHKSHLECYLAKSLMIFNLSSNSSMATCMDPPSF